MKEISIRPPTVESAVAVRFETEPSVATDPLGVALLVAVGPVVSRLDASSLARKAKVYSMLFLGVTPGFRVPAPMENFLARPSGTALSATFLSTGFLSQSWFFQRAVGA